MGKRLVPEQIELYNHLDEILWTDWDPVRVHGVEQARDEFNGYLPDLLRLVLGSAPAAQIATYLHGVATKRIGLSSALSDHVAVAEKIYRLEQKP